MAIKVIKHGTKRIAECKNCGCVFEYEKEDINSMRIKHNEYKNYVICPECRSEVQAMSEMKENSVTKITPRARRLGFSQRDCEVYYECPVCNKKFGSWAAEFYKVNGTEHCKCPNCESELRKGD